MQEYLPSERSERERLLGLVNLLADQVDDIVLQHECTRAIDVANGAPAAEAEYRDHLLYASARSHLGNIVNFCAKHLPDQSVMVAQAHHAVVMLHDSITGQQLLLVTTHGTTADGHSVRSTDVFIKDGAVTTGYALCNLDGQACDTRKSIAVSDGTIVDETLALVETKQPGLALGLLSGTENPLNVEWCVDQIRPLVLQQYDQAEADRYVAELVRRYEDKREAYAFEQQLGMSDLSTDDLNEAIALFQDPDRWS